MSSIKEHIEWTDSINNRLEAIYKELCDFEEHVNATEDEPVNLMELLNSVKEIHATAQSLRPKNEMLKEKGQEVQEQMELLQRSMDLLELETKTKFVGIDK